MSLHKLLSFHLVLLACYSAGLFCPPLAARDYKSIEDLRADRKMLAHQQRQIIANNDGCDYLYFPAAKQVTEANFLDARTSMLRGSQVDTIFFALAVLTISSTAPPGGMRFAFDQSAKILPSTTAR